MTYFESDNKGFDRETIVHVPVDSFSISRVGYLRDRLTAIREITRVSFSNSAPVNDVVDAYSCGSCCEAYIVFSHLQVD